MPPNLQNPRIPWMFLWFRKKHVSIPVPYQAMVSGGCLNTNGGEGGLLHVVVVRCLTVHTVTGPCLWHCQSRLNLSCRISVAAREAVLDCFADANGMFQVLLGTYSFVLYNDIRPESLQKAILHTFGAFLWMSVETWWDTEISTTTVVIS